MSLAEITPNKVILPLTKQKSSIRIADENGNHIARPTQEKNINNNSIEWMITNEEIGDLANKSLDLKGITELIEGLNKIKEFAEDSKYSTRESIKTTTEIIDKLDFFDIYKYTESFYSFEREYPSKIKIRITYKMGDYALAPHLFVLLPFNHKAVEIKNVNGKVVDGEVLGTKCCAYWKPNQEDIIEIVKALSHASSKHRDDLIKLLKS